MSAPDNCLVLFHFYCISVLLLVKQLVEEAGLPDSAKSQHKEW